MELWRSVAASSPRQATVEEELRYGIKWSRERLCYQIFDEQDVFVGSSPPSPKKLVGLSRGES